MCVVARRMHNANPIYMKRKIRWLAENIDTGENALSTKEKSDSFPYTCSHGDTYSTFATSNFSGRITSRVFVS